jgi:hypothetical protein
MKDDAEFIDRLKIQELENRLLVVEKQLQEMHANNITSLLDIKKDITAVKADVMKLVALMNKGF